MDYSNGHILHLNTSIVPYLVLKNRVYKKYSLLKNEFDTADLYRKEM